MKFSNRLLLFLAGVVFVLLGLFLFTNPVANLVAYSWWIAFGLLVSSIAAILICPKWQLDYLRKASRI